MENDRHKQVDDGLKSITDRSDYEIFESYINEMPIVKFSAKEWKFVSGYMQGINGILNCHNDEMIDLRPYLKHQRYGKEFRFTYITPSGDESSELAVSYNYDEQDDKVIFNIKTSADTQCAILRRVVYTNIANFNILKSICVSDTIMELDRSKELPDSTKYLTDIVPLWLLDDSRIYDLMVHILSILIVIHDRPKRHRMVREEISVHTERSYPAAISNKRDTNQIISRILMPVKDANEYVARMNRESSDAERNYVIESWERCGHYRRLPHSDKRIWIEATVCNRHKPLSDKEIVIKL